eukprot:scaffold5364_cov164-Amphora_coffeaeformis.AAC.14
MAQFFISDHNPLLPCVSLFRETHTTTDEQGTIHQKERISMFGEMRPLRLAAAFHHTMKS